VYEGRGWSYISDHVHFALGRISAHLNDFRGAVAFFSRLLAAAHQSPAAQSTFLREFLYVVQAGRPFLIFCLKFSHFFSACFYLAVAFLLVGRFGLPGAWTGDRGSGP
jgi:hypothetical protein